MRHFSKLSKQATKASCINNNGRFLAPCAAGFQNVGIRMSSEGIRFLDETESSSLKRGGGGRSSFSGIVATVFGASGFLGRYVCNGLGKIGTQLVIPYRGEHYDVMHLKLMGDLGQILFTPYEVRDEDSIRKSVKHSNVVINLIGRDWPTRNYTISQANAETAERIARISKEMGVEKFIHVSALNCNVEHEGFLNYGGPEFLSAKAESEDLVRHHYPNAVIFRPSDIYGQQDRFLRYYLSTWRYVYSYITSLPNKGKGIWKQPVFVGDVADGIVKSVFNPDSFGQTYEAVGPRIYELNELIQWAHRVTRRNSENTMHSIIDLKYDVITRLKGKLFEKSPTNPIGYISSEKFEREAVSDQTFDLLTLEDLGVELTLLEDRIKWELMEYKYQHYLHEDIGDHEAPEPPPYFLPQ